MADPQVHSIHPSKVIIGDRWRKDFAVKEMDELKQSILELGQLQPAILMRQNDGSLKLACGERRLRACSDLDINLQYILREEIEDEQLLRRIEFEENIKRADFTWQEEVLAKQEYHCLLQEISIDTPGKRGQHGVRDTAKALNESKSLTSADLELAFLLDRVPGASDAKSKSEAKAIIKKFKKTMARDIALDKAREGDCSLLAKDGSKSRIEANMERWEKSCLLGDAFEALEAFPDEYFSLCCWDPLWGVDFRTAPSQENIPDSQEQFHKTFASFAQLLHRKLARDSHLYVFFPITEHGFVYDVLEGCEFLVNRIPIIWHKIGAHRTESPDRWPGRCYEPIAFAHKGFKRLQQVGLPNIISTPVPSPTLKDIHPYSKHPQVFLELLSRSCSPGDKLLDPMAGSGMFAVAAEHLAPTLHLRWTQIEHEPKFRDLQLSNLALGYSQIIGEKPPEPTTPGVQKVDKVLDGPFEKEVL